MNENEVKLWKWNDCLLEHLLEAQVEAEASSEKDGWHPGVYSFRKHDDDNDDYYGGVGGCGGGDDDSDDVDKKSRCQKSRY